MTAPSVPRHTMSVEPSRLMRGKGLDWDHEVQIALPASYHHTDSSYPVLWVTDGSVGFEMAVGILSGLRPLGEVPEMIIVGVGCPRDATQMEFGSRRGFEFSPNERMAFDGVGGAFLESSLPPDFEPNCGGASLFLDFLVDEVRPSLSAEYRMDPDDQGLFGISAGGMFVGFALFAKPGAFAKYICGSPALNGGDFAIFGMEEKYAAEHIDLPARVFFGAGETELDDLFLAAWGIVGSMARMIEALRLRQHPSLVVHSRVFAGESHVSAPPLILSWGLRTLWADAAQPVTFEETVNAALEAVT